MHSGEPDVDFARALTLTQHACGAIMLVFNGSILLLIVKDNDLRNKQYRKYLCCLQISSLAFDTFSDFYSPIFLMHKGLAYSGSSLAHVLGIGKFVVIELVFFVEVILAYFACVYHRRSMIIGYDRRFSYRGWRRVVLYVALQVYGLAVIGGMIYFLHESVVASENSLPAELNWVRSRATYLFVRPDENMRKANYVSAPAGTIITVVLVAMLTQLVLEVKRGVRKASIATRRYQILAVRSLILQGAVPSLVYLIPSYANSCIQYAPAIFELGEKFDRFATVASPTLWVFITKHTFVCSLTILYCSPSYRRRIVMSICGSRAVSPRNETISELTIP